MSDTGPVEIENFEYRGTWHPSWVDRLGWDEPRTRSCLTPGSVLELLRENSQGSLTGARLWKRTVIPAVYGEWEEITWPS